MTGRLNGEVSGGWVPVDPLAADLASLDIAWGDCCTEIGWEVGWHARLKGDREPLTASSAPELNLLIRYRYMNLNRCAP